MKKIFVLLLLVAKLINAVQTDPLYDAILETDVDKVAHLLNEMGSLNDSQKIAYLNLAQHVIDNLNMENYIEKTKGGPESGLFLLGLTGFLISVYGITLYFAENGYSHKRDGLKPLAISSTILGIFFATLIKGCSNEQAIKFLKQKKLKDSLWIKQKIYFTSTCNKFDSIPNTI